ncbi:MAG TPA: DEAD/DEAH box helicase, partial [Planctomycetota bacterium]|nr:DEAD/DEAH box helicase [Planctomycetota bacterium]
MNSFAELKLVAPLQAAVRDAGYLTPTPIQAQSIPHLLAGRDLLGCARTGTGKTAAFALPILQRLAAAPHRAGGHPPVRALILVPTRELAAQVCESFRRYGSGLSLVSTVIYGGVGQGPQVSALRRGVDILVATPGRLVDLMGQGHVRLDRVEILGLDEADHMLDLGFIPDVRKVLAVVPRKRQTLFFSATMPPPIAKLAAQVCESFRRYGSGLSLVS